jgi:uncharacterized protein VirK/YbjX
MIDKMILSKGGDTKRQLLRAYLIRRFPLAYEIIFTPGNWDESLPALIAGHRAILRLMHRPGPCELVNAHPVVIYRPYRRYLATCFTKKNRRAVLLHHYRYLSARMTEPFFGALSVNPPQIWHQAIGSNQFSIVLAFPGELHHEGDVLLEFRQNGVPLYSLSFSIAPGASTGSTASDVILIARVQGFFGRFDAIRQATKACSDLSPCYLLMAAVQGIAHALDVAVIAGVKNSEQITAGMKEDTVVFDYDAFWQAHHGIEEQRFYLMRVPIPDKPIESISRAHRRRTLAKREFKTGIVEMAKARFASFSVTPC